MSANMKHSINRGCNLTLSSTNKQHCTSLNRSALKWLCAKPLSTWPSERMEGKVNRNLTPLTALLTSAALQTMCCNFTIIFSLPSSNRTASISSCPARSSVDNNLLKILASQLKTWPPGSLWHRLVCRILEAILWICGAVCDSNYGRLCPCPQRVIGEERSKQGHEGNALKLCDVQSHTNIQSHCHCHCFRLIYQRWCKRRSSF